MQAYPLPRWMRCWPGEHPCLDHGYQVPARKDVARAAFMINVWSGYWPTSLQKDVILWAKGVREASLVGVAPQGPPPFYAA
eukprot:7794925-Lingulodinium_polyedra.AAC.1